MYYTRDKRHFRGRKTIVKGVKKIHPNYIVGEDRNNYYSFGLTHSSSKGKKHKNYKLMRNPKNGDNSQVYMRKKMESANKNEYTSKKWDNYKMSKLDDDYVDSLIDKKRNCK